MMALTQYFAIMARHLLRRQGSGILMIVTTAEKCRRRRLKYLNGYE